MACYKIITANGESTKPETEDNLPLTETLMELLNDIDLHTMYYTVDHDKNSVSIFNGMQVWWATISGETTQGKQDSILACLEVVYNNKIKPFDLLTKKSKLIEKNLVEQKYLLTELREKIEIQNRRRRRGKIKKRYSRVGRMCKQVKKSSCIFKKK
jgi:hypothetical protein